MTVQTQLSTQQTLYEQDYYLWLQTTIKKLRSGQFSTLDLENLVEELESMSRSDKRALKSLLTRLLEHLLKLAYWKSEQEYNQRGWKGEIRTFRIQIKDLLKDSPSLKPYMTEIFEKCYSNARSIMIDVTGLPSNTFPQSDFATLEQVLDEAWFPDSN
jgi:hypothetical protein